MVTLTLSGTVSAELTVSVVGCSASKEYTGTVSGTFNIISGMKVKFAGAATDTIQGGEWEDAVPLRDDGLTTASGITTAASYVFATA